MSFEVFKFGRVDTVDKLGNFISCYTDRSLTINSKTVRKYRQFIQQLNQNSNEKLERK